jgi:hypothetical protein
MQDPIIGHRAFVGGAVLPVYLDRRGRQYVEDDDGAPLYGLWLYKGEDNAAWLGGPAERMAALAVGPRVNNATNEGPGCSEPAADA